MNGDLRFGSDHEPGIRRVGRARVRYVDDGTGRAPPPQDVQRIQALAVPPAWTDVWISADPHSHLQATGRDARGRKQYRYHARFVADRAEHKFGELGAFGGALPGLRRRVLTDLNSTDQSHDHVVAVIVRLLDLTGLRVGNDEYARTNQSFGLTTLHNRHAAVRGSRLRLSFRGKSAHAFDLTVEDPRLARLVKRCQDLPGQRLFEYVTEGGEVRSVGSADVNDYLRRHTDQASTAKTFQTWNASLFAAEQLVDRARHEDAPTITGLNAAIDEVAALLGNTRAVCRASYIHPVLIDRYQAETLLEVWDRPLSRRVRLVTANELRLLRLLRTAGRRQAGRPAR